VTDYSSRGPTWRDAFLKPDLVAPGDQLGSSVSDGSTIADTVPPLWVARKGGFAYVKLSGTSMAAGVTSGVVALALQSARDANRRASLTPNAVKAVLQYSAIRLTDDMGIEYDPLTQGAGSVNPVGAAALASAINTSAPVGVGWMTEYFEPATTIAGTRYEWGRMVYWGRSPVWHVDAIDTHVEAFGRNIVWGNKIVWGNLTLAGNATDPGDVEAVARNVVWGNLIWPTNIVWGNTLVGTWDGDTVDWGVIDATGRNIVWGNVADQNRIKVTGVLDLADAPEED
jgi:hypothetical protein